MVSLRDEEKQLLETALEIAQKLPYVWVLSPRIQIQVASGRVGSVRVFANSKHFPSHEELIDFHKYMGLKLEKKLSMFGFPKITATKDGVTLHIHCKGCPNGYEAVIEKFPHTRARTSCKLKEKPKE